MGAVTVDDGQAQQLYMEYRGLMEQLRRVQEYVEQTTQGIAEIAAVIEALDSLSKLKKGSRIFAPVANGIFVDASLNDTASVRMNVGGSIVVEKSVEEAKQLLEKQRTDLEQLRDRANADYVSLTSRLRAIEAAMEQEKDDRPAPEAAPKAAVRKKRGA